MIQIDSISKIKNRNQISVHFTLSIRKKGAETTKNTSQATIENQYNQLTKNIQFIQIANPFDDIYRPLYKAQSPSFHA